MITDFNPKRALGVCIALLILVGLSIAKVAVQRTDIQYIRCDGTGHIFAKTRTGLAYVGESLPSGVPVSRGCGFAYFEDPRTGFIFAEFNGAIAKVPHTSKLKRLSTPGSSASENHRSQFGNFLK